MITITWGRQVLNVMNHLQTNRWASKIQKSPIVGFGIAAGAVWLACLFQTRVWLTHSPTPFLFFFPVVFGVSWFCGFWPGVFSSVLSSAIVWWAFLPPFFAFTFDTLPQALFFSAVGVLVCLFHERFRRSERQLKIFATLAQSSNDFIGICRPDMTPIYVNDAGKKMVGLSSDAEVEKTGVLDYFHPEDRWLIESKAIPMLTATGRWAGEVRFRNFKSEEPIFTIWNAFLLRDEDGNPIAWATISPDLSRLKAVEERLRTSLEEKEVLLREIHHRVKNNLNIISSLLDLQCRYLTDSKERGAFLDSKNRVISMALIHEQLYQSENLCSIDFQHYVEELVSHLYQSYGMSQEKYSCEVNANDVKLDVDTAIPCSLIINELVSNSLKHAFKGRDHGRITVELNPVRNGRTVYRLSVHDDGIGVPASFNLEEGKSLGLKLVKALARQLGGEVSCEVQCKEGVSFGVSFSTGNKEAQVYA